MALSILESITRTVREHLIWCLIGVYVLAVLLPGPGNSLREISLGELPFSGGELNPTHFLLAILLYSVGLSIAPGAISGLRRHWKAVGLTFLGTWMIPVFVLSLFSLLPYTGLEQSVVHAFLLGAALTIAMPPANSASVWTDLSGGDASKTVTLIVLGTASCPLIAPTILRIFGSIDGVAPVQPADLLSSLEVLFAFVMLPAGLGICSRSLWQPQSSLSRGISLTQTSIALSALLTLNYANGAAALPQLWKPSTGVNLALPLLSVALCLFVFLCTVGLTLLRSKERTEQIPFVYSTGMRNTGAALVLAVSLFQDRPEIALVPVFYTIAQHVSAALIDRWMTAETESSTTTVEVSSPEERERLIEMRCSGA